MNPLFSRLPVWGVLALICVLTAMPVSHVTFNSDGVWYMDHALNVAQGRGLVDVDQQTTIGVRLFFPVVMGLIYRVVGPSELATYLFLRLFFLLNTLLVYRLTSKLFDRFTGFSAALLLLTSFSLSEWQTIINLDYLLAFWLLFSIYLLYEAFASMRRRLFFLAGLAMLAAIAVKEAAFVILALPLLGWAALPAYRSRAGLRGAMLALAAPLAAGLLFTGYRLSQGIGPGELWGFYSGVLEEKVSYLGLPALLALPQSLRAYYTLHLAPAFFLAPLIVAAWLYTVTRALIDRARGQSYRLLALTLLIFLPQTETLGRVGLQQRPGQNFIFFLLSYVAVAALVCDLAQALRRQIAARGPARLARPAGQMAQLALVAALILVQATESQRVWTESPRLRIDQRGSMRDHWSRFNTIHYLRGNREWRSELDAYRATGAWLADHAPAGAPALASLDTMRWLYWLTRGRYPMIPAHTLIQWDRGDAATRFPAPLPDAALLVVDNHFGGWRMLRQTPFLQNVRDLKVQYILLDSRDSILLPFLIEHPAFRLIKDGGNHWLFQVLPEQLQPAPLLWRLVGSSPQELQALHADADRFAAFAQNILRDALGLTEAEITALLTDKTRSAPLDFSVQQYMIALGKMDAARLAHLRQNFEAQAAAQPDAAWAWVLLAQVARLQSDPKAAWPAFEQARELGIPDETAALWVGREYIRLAGRYFNNDSPGQSVKMLENAAAVGLSRRDMAKELLPAIEDLAPGLFAAGLGERVAGVYAALIARSPQADELFSSQAAVYEGMEAWPQAAGVYEQMIERWPQYAPAYHGLGRARLHLGQAEAAAQALRTAIALRPDWELPYTLLIPLLAAEGRDAEAWALLQAAAQADPAADWPQQLITAHGLQPGS